MFLLDFHEKHTHIFRLDVRQICADCKIKQYASLNLPWATTQLKISVLGGHAQEVVSYERLRHVWFFQSLNPRANGISEPQNTLFKKTSRNSKWFQCSYSNSRVVKSIISRDKRIVTNSHLGRTNFIAISGTRVFKIICYGKKSKNDPELVR